MSAKQSKLDEVVAINRDLVAALTTIVHAKDQIAADNNNAIRWIKLNGDIVALARRALNRAQGGSEFNFL